MYHYLSGIYDSFMAYADYGKWEALVAETIGKTGVPREAVLDLGCGTGTLLFLLEPKFQRLKGLDLSDKMLALARKKYRRAVAAGENAAGKIEFVSGDMISFEFPEKYPLITSFFDTVNHILSEEELSCHFRSVKNALTPGGVYIFDLVDRAFMGEMFPQNSYVDNREEFCCIWELERDEDIDYIKATYFIREKGESYKKYYEVYTKKIFSAESIQKCIEKSGLVTVERKRHKDLMGSRWVYVLKS
ncbi:MAG: class I SAM-dependent methyltransferase [Fusobacteriaceae bacterium]|jgi:SAM-dependent methyltransferase|nr:class I SAM-dependent methyltransferase [Fusobacteriaceae bacterium]